MDNSGGTRSRFLHAKDELPGANKLVAQFISDRQAAGSIDFVNEERDVDLGKIGGRRGRTR